MKNHPRAYYGCYWGINVSFNASVFLGFGHGARHDEHEAKDWANEVLVRYRHQVEVVMIRLDRGQVHVEDPRPWDCDSAAGKVSASEGGFSGGKGARVKPTF